MSYYSGNALITFLLMISFATPANAQTENFLYVERFYDLFRYTDFGLKGRYNISLTKVIAIDDEYDENDSSENATYLKWGKIDTAKGNTFRKFSRLMEINFNDLSQITEISYLDFENGKYYDRCFYTYDPHGNVLSMYEYQRGVKKDSVTFTNTYQDGLLIRQKINLPSECIEVVSMYADKMRTNCFTHECPILKLEPNRPVKRDFGEIFGYGGFQLMMARYYTTNDFETVVYEKRTELKRLSVIS